jgi:hypothetical protein
MQPDLNQLMRQAKKSAKSLPQPNWKAVLVAALSLFASLVRLNSKQSK